MDNYRSIALLSIPGKCQERIVYSAIYLACVAGGMASAKFGEIWRRNREKYPLLILLGRRGGLMVSSLDSGASGPGSSPGRGPIVLCSWARHLTLTVPLSTQVNKWVPANCWGNLTNCGEVTCYGLASRPGGSRNTSSRFMLRKPG